MAHDVFISYSTKDKTIADAVCAKLEEHKIRVWIAPRDVPAGSNFAASIIRAINACRVFVLIWSANANTSEHILNEINQAFNQGIIIIPFRIQDIQPTDAMRYYFGRTHWLDAIDPPLEKHIGILKDTILINLDREPHPSAPTPVFEESPREATEHIKKPSRQKMREAEAGAFQRSKALPAKITKFIPFAAGVVAVLTLVVLLGSGLFKASPPAGIAQSSPSPAVSITPTSTIRSTATSTPITPTKTVRPTATSTPIPAWMEEVNTFAEPILEAIAGRTPNVQDSGDTPRSWMKTERDEPFIEYVNGEMVASGPFSWTMWYTDFVIEMDYRFIDPSGTRWMFHARGYQVQFAFYDGGEVHVNELTDFPNAAKPGGSVNHVLIIVEDGVALFVNDQPKYYEELQGWKNGEAEWWIERWGELKGSVAFDNIKIWNLNDLKDLP